MTDIWDEIFGDLGGLQKRVEGMMRSFGDPNVHAHGYTVYRGPDGVPHVHEFGSGTAPTPAKGVREPLTDVCVDGNVVRITVELPGVSKEDIQLEGTETTMTVIVDTEKRKFEKTIPLTISVDPDSAKAEYNNGILEVTLNTKEKPGGTKKIEIK